jgi:hypothetical protein
MKKPLCSPFGVCLFTVFILTISCTQTFKQPLFEHPLSAVPFAAPIRLNEIRPGAPLTMDAISDKIRHRFNKTFANAKDEQWFFVTKRVFWVSFYDNGRYTRAVYTKNGTMLYSFIQSSEEYLPEENKKLLKAWYKDYDITHATEATSYGQKVWFVNLKNENELVIVRVNNVGMDELARFPIAKNP